MFSIEIQRTMKKLEYSYFKLTLSFTFDIVCNLFIFFIRKTHVPTKQHNFSFPRKRNTRIKTLTFNQILENTSFFSFLLLLEHLQLFLRISGKIQESSPLRLLFDCLGIRNEPSFTLHRQKRQVESVSSRQKIHSTF